MAHFYQFHYAADIVLQKIKKMKRILLIVFGMGMMNNMLRAQNVGINEPSPVGSRLVVKGSQSGLENILLLKNGFNDTVLSIGNNIEGHFGTETTPGVFTMHGSGEALRLQGYNAALHFYDDYNTNKAFMRLSNNNFQIGTTAQSNMPVNIAPTGYTTATFQPNGNVGIGISFPNQKLDINGAIKIGTTTTNSPGSLRYENGKLELGNGTTWSAMENLPSGAIVGSDNYSPTNPLLAAGFTFHSIQETGVTRFDKFSGSAGQLGGSWMSTYTFGDPNRITPFNHTSSYNGLATAAGDDVYITSGLFTWIMRYNTLKDSFSNVSLAGLPQTYVNLTNHGAVWTGSKLIIWGGRISGVELNTGYIYNPTTNSWTAMSTVNAPAPRSDYSYLWNGTNFIVWGGKNGAALLNSGAMYNPSNDTWTPISSINAPSNRWANAIVWHNNKLLIWGGKNDFTNSTTGILTDGAMYDPGNGSWTSISSANAPEYLYVKDRFYAYNGTDLFALGTTFETNQLWTRLYKYNFASNNWLQMASLQASNGGFIFQDYVGYFFNGKIMISGGKGSIPLGPGQPAIITYGNSPVYDIATDTWSNQSLPKYNTAIKRTLAVGCSATSCCFMFGGYIEDGTAETNIGGGRYFFNSQANLSNNYIKYPNSIMYYFKKN